MQKREPEILQLPVVSVEARGQRLDKWLTEAVPELSRTRISALIKGGNLACNGESLPDAAYKLKGGESFVLSIPPAQEASPNPQEIPLDIMYEDKDIIVINKKAGMVVHPAAGNYDNTLVNALLAHCKDLSGIGGVLRPGIVHRIDKETSGILVAAKNDVAHNALSKQFAEHSIARIYKAIVWGVPIPLAGRIEGNIGRSRTNRQKMTIFKSGGKSAVTNYKTERIFGDGAAALLECRLETGRTHQIRVHLTAHGHPLIGDKIYGGSQKTHKKLLQPDVQKKLCEFPRQALHAGYLAFVHPCTGETLCFEADMPEDMQELVKILSVRK